MSFSRYFYSASYEQVAARVETAQYLVASHSSKGRRRVKKMNYLIFILVTLSARACRGQKMTYEQCENTPLGPTPGPTQDPEYDCRPRDFLVKLDLPDDYFHVLPDHINVQRCGGSCHLDRHKSCVPTASGVKNKSVPVWLYPAASSSPDCAVVNVEEHTECQCGCATDAMSCKRNQIFEESKCACTCLDQNARQACYRRPGWVWSEETCQCLCKAKKDWPQCATGSKFDPLETCSCVSYSEYAGSVLIIMVVVLSLGLITTISSLIICHRQKLGPFKHQRRDAVMEKIRRKSSANSNKNLPLIS